MVFPTPVHTSTVVITDCQSFSGWQTAASIVAVEVLGLQLLRGRQAGAAPVERELAKQFLGGVRRRRPALRSRLPAARHCS